MITSMNTQKQSQNSKKNKFVKGDTIILDGAEYEVLDFGEIEWSGQTFHDCYGLWDKDDYGRIEHRSYVDKYAEQ
jgi:hypothetical protein